jgi:hypothetical protein
VTNGSHLPLSQDAALVVALAGTAMPFSHSAADEAERWLRTLRLHGRVGAALQALGVGEAPLMTLSEPLPVKPVRESTNGRDVVDEVTRRAGSFATDRGAECVATVDLLASLLEVYGRLFDRALYQRGATRDELLERLSSSEQPVETRASA